MITKIIKRFAMVAVALQLIATGVMPAAVHASSDTTAPTLTSLSFSQTSVDVTQSPQTITAQVQATDTESEITRVFLRLLAPSGKTGYDINTTWSTAGPNTWQGSLNVQQHIADGDWEVDLQIEDAAGNIQSWHGQTLAENGYIGYISIISNHDAAEPVVESLTLSSTTADVTTQERSINVSIVANDSASGILGTALIFSLISSNQGSEQWDGTVRIPQYIEDGFWEARLLVYDRAGNTAYMEGAELAAAGYSDGITVTSVEDVTGPVIHSVSFSPDAVNVSESEQTVTNTVTLSDDLSGVIGVGVVLSPPSGSGYELRASFQMHTTNNDGTITWTSTFTIPTTANIGEWKAHVIASDAVGNVGYMNTQQLIDANFEHAILVHHGDQSAAAAMSSSSTSETPPTEEEVATALNGTATQGLIVFYEVNDSINSVTAPQVYPINTVEPTQNITRHISL
jgi:hypothetical protein